MYPEITEPLRGRQVKLKHLLVESFGSESMQAQVDGADKVSYVAFIDGRRPRAQ